MQIDLTPPPELGRDLRWLLEGLAIIAKYEPNADVAAEHDILYVGSIATREQMTEGERTRMEELGWREDTDSWAHFT